MPDSIAALVAEGRDRAYIRRANAEYVRGKDRVGELVVFSADAALFDRLADALEEQAAAIQRVLYACSQEDYNPKGGYNKPHILTTDTIRILLAGPCSGAYDDLAENKACLRAGKHVCGRTEEKRGG